MVIPLLYEANFASLCNETWVVYCTLDQQYERLKHRDGFTYDQAKIRIESQLSLEEKRNLADKVISNTMEFETCFKQVDMIL